MNSGMLWFDDEETLESIAKTMDTDGNPTDLRGDTSFSKNQTFP